MHPGGGGWGRLQAEWSVFQLEEPLFHQSATVIAALRFTWVVGPRSRRLGRSGHSVWSAGEETEGGQLLETAMV